MRIKTRISALRMSLFMVCLLPSLFFARDVNAKQFYWVLAFPSAVSGGELQLTVVGVRCCVRLFQVEN